MYHMKKLVRMSLIAALALLLTAALCCALADEVPEHEHYALCSNPNVCAVCGMPYSGDEIYHTYEGEPEWQFDAESHWKICPTCGRKTAESDHWSRCDNPGVCYICGQPCSEEHMSHLTNGESVFEHDAEKHWRVCPTCGKIIEQSEHYANCDNPNVCARCGVDYSGSRVYHTYDSDKPYETDSEYHWRVCSRCGEVINKSRHYAYCDNPGVCAACGVEYTGSSVSHEIDWEAPYESDANYHWRVCTRCGEPCDRSRHAAACDNPGVCVECGAEYTGSNVSHEINWDDPYQSDATHHWRVCAVCGLIVDRSEHRAVCDAPGVCAECGAAYTGSNVSHKIKWDDPYRSDENYHWRVCSGCGEIVEKSEHFAACDKPGVCEACGAAYTGSNVSHNVDWDGPYQHNGTHHWLVCKSCGAVVDKSTHYAACDKPGVCDACGVAYTGTRVSHETNWDAPYQYDETYHWRVCVRCGEPTDKYTHYAACDNPGVCMACGAAYTGDNIEHEWDSPYQHDEECHWKVCSKCGETFNKSSHYARCSKPSVCMECGVAIPVTPDVVHNGDSEYLYDAEKHWMVCPDCGKVIDEGGHVAACDNPGQCVTCGAPYTGDNRSHDWDSPVQHDAGEHWRICIRCGEEFSRGEHYASCEKPGVCYLCGEPYTGDNISHYYSRIWHSEGSYHWKICPQCGEITSKGLHYTTTANPGACAGCGQPFNVTGFTYIDNAYAIFDNGVIKTDVNGLFQDPNNGSSWYYCAGGYAQTQYTGLAMYDGAWFYVSSGRLDTEFAAIVKYDTGLFVVGAGRVMTEVQGLVQDPRGGTWFYCADGMVQTQYTGLAYYDQAWFYVVEGRLATEFTGDVVYDGQTFHVVNGQLAA